MRRTRARLVVTYNIEFTDEALTKVPSHQRDALSLLRKIVLEANLQEIFEQDALDFADSSNGRITSVGVEVAP